MNKSPKNYGCDHINTVDEGYLLYLKHECTEWDHDEGVIYYHYSDGSMYYEFIDEVEERKQIERNRDRDERSFWDDDFRFPID